MPGGGRPLFTGANAQSWAALSLFLQYVQDQSLVRIEFEAEKLKDFVLVFSDGRRLICESKASELTYNTIKRELTSLNRSERLKSEDEILFICKKLSSEVKRDFKHQKYFKYFKEIRQHVKAKGIPETMIERVRFWEVPKQVNKVVAASLLSQMLGIWVSKAELENILYRLLYQNVYEGSESGAQTTRDDFLRQIAAERERIKSESGYYQAEQDRIEQIEELIESIKQPRSKQWATAALKTLSGTPDMLLVALRKLEEDTNLDLSAWDMFWKATIPIGFFRFAFPIFEKNIASPSNRAYLAKLFKQILEPDVNYFHDQFLKYHILKVFKKILQISRDNDKSIFELVQLMLKPSLGRYLYHQKTEHSDRFDRQEIAQILYNLYEQSDSQEFKTNIVHYILEIFNVTEDRGEHWIYTPPHIYEIVKDWLQQDFGSTITPLTVAASKQMAKTFKQYGLRFKGWELWGSGIAQAGSDFSIDDRWLVSRIIQPALLESYSSNKSGTWRIVKKKFITKEHKVSSGRPDFLNRAAIPVVLERYASGPGKREALQILNEFLSSKRGLTRKGDLIFADIRSYSLDVAQIWRLIKIAVPEGALPSNVFIQQITVDLSQTGNRQALRKLLEWSTNPEYFGSFFLNRDFYNHCTNLLQHTQTHQAGIEIFSTYLDTDYFRNNMDSFDVWGAADVLVQILESDFATGHQLLSRLLRDPSVASHQTLFGATLASIGDTNRDLLLNAYTLILQPVLQECGNHIDGVVGLLPQMDARRSIVQFAQKLAGVRLFREAQDVIEIFISDPDPPVDGSNYPDDPDGTFNYHQKIVEGETQLTPDTVRGWCAWVLQRFVTTEGQPYLARVVDLLELLGNDPNFYVRLQMCFTLKQFVHYRHSVMPDSNERFMSEDLVARVKGLSFRMLGNPQNHQLPGVMLQLAQIFGYFRELNDGESLTVVQILTQSGYSEVIGETMPLILHLAEFRSVRESGFKPEPFRGLLFNLIQNGDGEVRSQIAWQIKKMGEEVSKYEDEQERRKYFNITLGYFKRLLDRYGHHVFSTTEHFVYRHIDTDYGFEGCFRLWTILAQRLTEGLHERIATGSLEDIDRRSFDFTDDILLVILRRKGPEAFLQWLEFLLEAPSDSPIRLMESAKTLVNIAKPKTRIDGIFRRLVERNSIYYPQYKQWQTQTRSRKSKTFAIRG